MNFFTDRKFKKIAKKEDIKAPEKYLKSIDETLNNLQDTNEKIHVKPIWGYSLKFALAIALIAFVALPNVSPEVSYAMQKLPVIGDFVKVITIKNYFDKDGNSELNANIPNIKNSDNVISQSNEKINAEVYELTQRVINSYYKEKKPENHMAVEINSDVITNTSNWFTLKLTISETLASSSLEYKYYHIDKKTDQMVRIADLFDGEEYKEVISDEIKKQMKDRMKENENIVYWIDAELKDCSFSKINDNQNFYFSENGNIVIVFDKYEVGPGSSGAPEFEIDKSIYERYQKK